MVQKQFCDLCGAEIPEPVAMQHNEHVKNPQGRFVFGAVVCEEFDDLCKNCGAVIRDYIKLLKQDLLGDLAIGKRAVVPPEHLPQYKGKTEYAPHDQKR